MIIFVDVDDTLLRESGGKQFPIPNSVAHVKALAREGATLYCWSSGGAEYAERSARRLGIDECFVAFLPKPDAMLDDQHPSNWRRMICVHPNEATSMSLEDYKRKRDEQ